MNNIEKANGDLVVLNTPIQSYQTEPDEKYMSARQKKHFANMLTLFKQELMQGNEKARERLRHDSIIVSDITDQASQEANRQLDLRVQGREHRLIKKIDAALMKLIHDQQLEQSGQKGDKYGYCDDCGGQIGLRRLEARPTANLCFDCKTLEEMREKQRGK